jgi:hypothetical protein
MSKSHASSQTKSAAGALPNLLVIGAGKCGTTSLHSYLDLHPEIAMSRQKELHFFAGRRSWEKGLDWYRAQFNSSAGIRGESSVTYSAYPQFEGVPQRIQSIVPEVKLIYMVRDPVQRMLSSYVHRFSDNEENRNLEDALGEEGDQIYLARSQYHRQLQQYLEYFPLEQILVVALEDLQRRRRATLRRIFEFLGVGAEFDSPAFDQVKHRSEFKRRKGRLALFLRWLAETPPARLLSADRRRAIGKVLYRPFSRPISQPVLSEELRRTLNQRLEQDVRALRELTGQGFSDWNL